MKVINMLFRDLRANAIQLKNELGIAYDTEKVETMLDGLCEALDNENKYLVNLYVSALMLRFWYLVAKLKAKSPGHGDDTSEFAYWLYEGIMYACKYRAWQTKKVNGTQAIHQCVNTIRLQHHYDSNLDKHRANYNTMSLDDPIGDADKDSFADTLEDERYTDSAYMGDGDAAARDIIQIYINKKQIVEAIILDTIAFNDVEHEVKETVEVTRPDGTIVKKTTKHREFWPFRCVQILASLPDDYGKYFETNYRVSSVELDAALTAVRTANNQKLYRFLRKTLATAKDSLRN
jgi:hypothetical protein